jgi:hypothetical protein
VFSKYFTLQSWCIENHLLSPEVQYFVVHDAFSQKYHCSSLLKGKIMCWYNVLVYSFWSIHIELIYSLFYPSLSNTQQKQCIIATENTEPHFEQSICRSQQSSLPSQVGFSYFCFRYEEFNLIFATELCLLSSWSFPISDSKNSLISSITDASALGYRPCWLAVVKYFGKHFNSNELMCVGGSVWNSVQNAHCAAVTDSFFANCRTQIPLLWGSHFQS